MRASWAKTTLDELVVSGIVLLGRGNVISKRDMEANPGPFPVYSSAQNDNGRIGSYNNFMFDEELITWSIDGGGYVFYRPQHKFSVTNIGGYLRIVDDTKFLYPFLAAVLQALHSQQVFDWQNKAHPSVIRKLYNEIPLPSLIEQRRIVDTMASINTYIAALQQQADDARSARNAVLHELLTAGGADWTETTLGDIAEVVGGGTPATSNPAYWDGDIVWLTPTEVVAAPGSVLMDSARKITESGLKNSGARLLPEGTVILTSRASVGFSALAGTALATNQGFQSLIPSAQINNKFLMFWIQNNQQEFKSRAAGSTFKEISKANVRSIALALPPLSEQKRIVETVTAMDDVVSATEQAVRVAQELRSGLLSSLISGDHEIPESYDYLLGAA